jgi:diguanylate cyclase
MDDAQRWREKYLASLEQQEALEQRWEARNDLLRRGLVCSSLAAEGGDKSVDQCMQDLRDTLRRDDAEASISALIPRLEKTVLESELHRQQRLNQIASAVVSLATQLLNLELPSNVRKPLKRFCKHLDQRARQGGELPVLLGELSQLQQQILSALGADSPGRPSLVQRLFGQSRSTLESVPAPAADNPIEENEEVEEEPPRRPSEPSDATGPQPLTDDITMTLEASQTEPVVHRGQDETATPASSAAPPAAVPAAHGQPFEAAPAEGNAGQETSHDPAYALPTLAEPGYSAIAKHVEETLLGLLDELPLPERQQPQTELLRQRITGGLNLYELVAVLDDIAVLVLSVTDASQREFEGYLKGLNDRLLLFQTSLRDVHDNYTDSTQAVRSLDSELRLQVGGLHSSVRDAIDLHNLKDLVANRLNGLLDTMEHYKQEREEREHQVSERLHKLVQRVAGMEAEAKQYRDHFEEQRQKALLDPLTGLPNRAALTERMEFESARRQRYGGELLLAILDIDHFKHVNDDFGHLAGDKVLKIIAVELSKRLRKTDFIARFGGEEFVLLLPSTPLSGGLELLDALRLAIADCPFHFRGERVVITLSSGISAFADGETSEQVFARADQALYRAKRSGRNRIEQD